MLAKILAGVVVAFGVTGMGLHFANSKSTCSPCGSSGPRQAQMFTLSVPAVTDPDCCYAGSPCCSSDDCCLKQEATAKVKVSCCDEGKCCEAESAAK
jgi:hypothetical protein